MTENKLRVLLIHNTIAEYRFPLFEELAKRVDLTLVLFDAELNEKIYTDKARYNDLKGCTIYTKLDYKQVDSLVNAGEFDIVILPSLDDLHCYKIVRHFGKFRKKVKLCIWWEKWEPIKLNAGLYKNLKKYTQRPFLRLALKKIDFALSFSEEAKYFLNYLTRNKIKVFENPNTSLVAEGVNGFNIRHLLSIDDDAKIILYLGRVIERKGLGVLLDAFTKLEKKQNIHLIVGGVGDYLENAKEKSRELNLDSKVSFIGKVNHLDRFNYFTQSDVFVLPSYFYRGFPEPWGLTVNESLGYSLPVVVTNAVGAKELVQEGLNGYIVNENDSKALEQGILKALKLPRELVPKLNYFPVDLAENLTKALRLGFGKKQVNL